MKRFISTQHEIHAPIDKVWPLIAKGDGVESWIPIIKSSELRDNNQRFCVMHEGGDLVETILSSEGTKTFMYRIDQQEAFPASNIVGIMRVEEKDANQTRLYWDLELDVEQDEVFTELKKNIEQIYQLSASKLSDVA